MENDKFLKLQLGEKYAYLKGLLVRARGTAGLGATSFPSHFFEKVY